MGSGEAWRDNPTVLIPARKGAKARSHAASTFFFFLAIVLTVGGGGYAAIHYAHPDRLVAPRKASAQAMKLESATPLPHLPLSVVDPPTSPITYTTISAPDDPPPAASPRGDTSPRAQARPTAKAARGVRQATPRTRPAAAPTPPDEPHASPGQPLTSR